MNPSIYNMIKTPIATAVIALSLVSGNVSAAENMNDTALSNEIILQGQFALMEMSQELGANDQWMKNGIAQIASQRIEQDCPTAPVNSQEQNNADKHLIQNAPKISGNMKQ